MNNKERHARDVKQMQEQIKSLYGRTDSTPLTLKYHSNESFTTRTKSYKSGCPTIDCGALNQVLEINSEKQTALVEPRVTMEALVKATLPFGLTVPVIPELKDITVGGAIMGMGAESASHQCGTFNEICTTFELLCGDGSLIKATPHDHADLFYGIAGSYGSLGVLTLAEIQLVPAKDFILLRYHPFANPLEALLKLHELTYSSTPPDFLDGIVFSKEQAIVIEGELVSKEKIAHLRKYSLNKWYSPMYYQHVKDIVKLSQPYEEYMSHADYFFRYDQGAFWMGSYLTYFPLFKHLITQGLLNFCPENISFTAAEIEKFHQLPNSNSQFQTFLRPFITGKNLCKALHKAEKWIQNRFVIQDFCIPERQAPQFLTDICHDPAIFPIWLLPAKATLTPQIFAPHLLQKGETEGRVINFGVYGIPAYAAPISEITQKLEHKVHAFGGRKALYARSYYSENEFWDIYSRPAYNALREKMHAKCVWHEITDKVLSE